ncbi:MAG: CDP-alcohol phosphatidyltransferase family protein [Phycisphaerae bacterium]
MKIRGVGDIPGRAARRRERVLKTIGVLPSLATLGNLTCGVGAIYLSVLSAQAAASGQSAEAVAGTGLTGLFSSFLSAAAYLIIAAMVFDGMDGRLARLTRKTSEFGAQLDSLADVVSFGVAPAFLVLCIAQPTTSWNISTLSFWERTYWRAEWVMAAVYVGCTALRLARFNVENEEDESAHLGFRGLPSPGAAGAIIGAVILHQELLQELAHPRTMRVLAILMPPFALVAGLLMVSPFRYAHLVNAVLRGRRPFWQVVSIAIGVLIGLVVQFQMTVAIVAVAYALSGPILAGFYKLTGRSQPEEPLMCELEPDRLDPQETFDESSAAAPPTAASEGEDGADPVRFTG